MSFTCIFFGVIFTVAGVLFAAGKLHKRITFWKNMSEEEKQKIRIVPLCKNIGYVIIASGVIFLLGGLFEFFREKIFLPAMLIWLVLSGLDLWYIEKSKRYIQK